MQKAQSLLWRAQSLYGKHDDYTETTVTIQRAASLYGEHSQSLTKRRAQSLQKTVALCKEQLLYSNTGHYTEGTVTIRRIVSVSEEHCHYTECTIIIRSLYGGGLTIQNTSTIRRASRYVVHHHYTKSSVTIRRQSHYTEAVTLYGEHRHNMESCMSHYTKSSPLYEEQSRQRIATGKEL